MSYFIANQITIAKDFKTFKVKGGDNNVVPRYNSWSGDIDIAKLFYNINSGNIKIFQKTERALFIDQLVWSSEYGGSWEEETDYYHMFGYMSRGKDELIKSIETMEGQELQEYQEKCLAKMKIILDNFEQHKRKFDEFNESFLTKLKYGLKHMPKAKYVMQIYNDEYILLLKRTSAYTCRDKTRAQKFGKYRALVESRRFTDCEPVLA